MKVINQRRGHSVFVALYEEHCIYIKIGEVQRTIAYSDGVAGIAGFFARRMKEGFLLPQRCKC